MSAARHFARPTSAWVGSESRAFRRAGSPSLGSGLRTRCPAPGVFSRMLVRLAPSVLVTVVAELAVIALAVVAPADPEPVARPVVVLCRKSDVVCPQIRDGIRAEMEALG